MTTRLGLAAAALALGGLLAAPAPTASPTDTGGPLAGLVPEQERAPATSAGQGSVPRIDVPDYPRASSPRRHEHFSEAYALDDNMRRCLAALKTVTHLPLRYYRMSCAPVLEHGNSKTFTALVGGNTYRTSEDIVIGSYLAPAALDRLIKHESVHGYVIEHRSVQYALERWAYPERTAGGLTGSILDDPTAYPHNPSEVLAAAWARCHGGGPDPVIEDDRMSCADADRIIAAADER